MQIKEQTGVSFLFLNEAEEGNTFKRREARQGKRKITASRSGNICEITSPVVGGRRRKWGKLQELCKRRETFKRDERAGGFTASQSL